MAPRRRLTKPSNAGDRNKTKASCATPSSEAPLSTCSSKEAMAFNSHSNKDLGMASGTHKNKAPVSALQADRSEAEGEESRPYRGSSEDKQTWNSWETNIRFPKLVEEALPKWSRRLNHGWIGSDDEGEKMKLKPTQLTETFAKILHMQEMFPGRKGRWDIRPEDM